MSTIYFADSQTQSLHIASYINKKGFTTYRTGYTVQIFNTPKPVADKLFKEAKKLFEEVHKIATTNTN